MSSVNDEFVIERAVRKQALLRLAISAVSGAGKTRGALRLARGIVEYMLEVGLVSGMLDGKVGVVDTERNSASLYAEMYPFDRISLVPPYSVKRYLGAAQALANAGKTVIIIDQISHQWAGQGGMLEFVDLLRGRSQNEFAAWKEATPEQNEFLEGLLALPAHLICTMRAKTAYVMEEKTRRDGTKFFAPKRVGLKPIQREGVEYEFTTVMDLDLDTKAATVSKDRTGLFVDPESLQSKRFVLTEGVGKDLARWLFAGEADPGAAPAAPPQERAEAVRDSAMREMDDCKNVPDLAKIFSRVQRELKQFAGLVEDLVIDSMLVEITAKKDQRKAALGAPSSPPPLDAIPPDWVIALEDLARAAGVPVAKALAAVKEPSKRLAALPRQKTQELVDWLCEEVRANTNREPTLPKELLEAGLKVPARRKSHFDDMQDDIPW